MRQYESHLDCRAAAKGRYEEAEPLFRRGLEARERTLGKDHPDTLSSVDNLAALYHDQGRYEEAEPLFRRGLEARERTFGKDHPQTLTSVNNLAMLYRAQGRYGEAEPLLRRVLEASERTLGRDHPGTLASANNLAALCVSQGRYGEAEPLLGRVLEASERAFGEDHPQTLTSVNNLAMLYRDQGRFGEVEPLFRRALDASERSLGKDHPDTLKIVGNLAGVYLEQGDWGQAAYYLRGSTAAIAFRTLRISKGDGQALTGQKKSEAERLRWQFLNLVKAEHRLAARGTAQDAKAAHETFEAAQWALGSEAAQSLAQMAARGASGKPELSARVRERQDRVADWQKLDRLRNAWLGQDSAKRDVKAEANNQAELAAIENRITKIDQDLAAKFPDYAALANPAPLSVQEVQAQLGSDEALVMFLDTPEWKPTPEESFIWIVTKTNLRWVRSNLGTAALTREVQALRCGLDGAAWEARECAELTTEADEYAGRPLPFDLARAHALYRGLFGEVEDFIKGKHLLIVPSGALTQLPFQVLVTAPPPRNGDFRSAAWLIREHAITVLPAVSSLKALRRVARPSAAKKPMIGFGNPLLKGHDASSAERAKLARDKRRCPETGLRRFVSLRSNHRGVKPLIMRGGLADVAFIRDQEPLPETADELCAVARDLHADASEIRLGARATEREVKALSASGKLAQYRIVHFATHGALSGEINGNAEPGLLMTPPDKASEEDDGYLTASEIASLKLDADWVILSACNTAGGGASGAEALSGLARAFFYAQARALLVSHWEVNSETTVKLITGAMNRLAADKAMGRAEAMRQSMLALIDTGTPQETHPSFWAPFVVVGEGGVSVPHQRPQIPRSF